MEKRNKLGIKPIENINKVNIKTIKDLKNILNEKGIFILSIIN